MAGRTPNTGDADAEGGFEALTRRLLSAPTVQGTLEQVTDAAVHLVSGADLASVTLRDRDGRFSTPVRTHPVAVALDEVQYRAKSGPCLDAAVPDGPGFAASDDLATERRWPEFSRAAHHEGYRAITSTELLPTPGQGISGALNIYSRAAHGLSDADRHTALLLATHASLALAHARVAELADLARAVDSRDVIGQAKGILMTRRGIGADEAFALLRRTSQELNVKLVDLARTLVTRHDEIDPS
ncbi:MULTISPECIES: ANTAR domain-containing protein [Actinosynnema]|uniref:ANTAR domain-containing protein n=1 Tax=Actinosynnema TaxID=40566 RepID=UPI0020A54F8C|nr:ANTAR domain-containing protein [Actinosynnema pretiosum]MCP2092387.1 GAF domain-containing protein [Actinosynnema pretiosum]